MANKIPIIDISGLINDTELKDEVCQQIDNALREFGFFYIINHEISDTLLQRIDSLGRQFFAQPLELKQKCRKTADSWRGFFTEEDETYSGNIDRKEGIYFGPEEEPEDIKHGVNQYPDIPEFRETVLSFINQMTCLGHKLVEGIALSLNLDKHYFAERYTDKPSILMRILSYPPLMVSSEDSHQTDRWGIGEHTDYGLLTILKQDNTGGLQVKCKTGWIDAPPVDHSFVCNIGDMLQRITGGLYKSNPHRVKSPMNVNNSRISIPFFFEPNLNASVELIEGIDTVIDDNKDDRWDKASVHHFNGTYGDYLSMKMNNAFEK